MMDEDPILKELHEAKDKLGRKYGFRVEALGRALMRKQEGASQKLMVLLADSSGRTRHGTSVRHESGR